MYCNSSWYKYFRICLSWYWLALLREVNKITSAPSLPNSKKSSKLSWLTHVHLYYKVPYTLKWNFSGNIAQRNPGLCSRRGTRFHCLTQWLHKTIGIRLNCKEWSLLNPCLSGVDPRDFGCYAFVAYFFIIILPVSVHR